MKKLKLIKRFVSLAIPLIIILFNLIVPKVHAEPFTGAVAIAGLSAGESLIGLSSALGVTWTINELKDNKEELSKKVAENYVEFMSHRVTDLTSVNTWLDNLGKGLIDTTSDCYSGFKEWCLSNDVKIQQKMGFGGTINSFDYLPDVISYNGINLTMNKNNYKGANLKEWLRTSTFNDCTLFVIGVPIILSDGRFAVNIYNASRDNYGSDYSSGFGYTTLYFDRQGRYDYVSSGIYSISSLPDIYYKSYSTVPIAINGYENTENVGGILKDIISSATDYLQALTRTKEKNQLGDIIDVTDPKNPIIVRDYTDRKPVPINYNKGSNRKPDNDKNDKNELVWANVTWDKLEDNWLEEKNVVNNYNQYIENNYNNQELINNYVVSPSPITNINNYFNTMPITNIPIENTVINNNYTWNNIENNNNLITAPPYNFSFQEYNYNEKFPFCIPFDIYSFFALFYTERQAPEITIPFPVMDVIGDSYGIVTHDVVISLADYEIISEILRVMFFAVFIVGLAFVTRYLIKG